ncbi:MAG: hypothetical protein GWP19_10550 [Planctomycetia bacterium]|nr:hypothetical protein [Planctomycetia bacterium]
MISNLEKYNKDLDTLIDNGQLLLSSMQKECHPNNFEAVVKKKFKTKSNEYIKKIPIFSNKYQDWYSESLITIKQLLPDRMNDFIRLYEKPKTTRKEITHENYTIEDYLNNITVTSSMYGKIVGPESAIPRFKQQLNILKSIKKRFTSTLFDIKQLVQADLFDSELEAAKELVNKGYLRGAGAIAGVVLEKHLAQVCINQGIKIIKKKSSISDFNDKLKGAKTYETPTWRKIQHLGDLRNLCDHKKKRDPNIEDVDELIEGVEKITKTIF